MYREALDLFGGRSAVLRRMTGSVRGRLKAMTERQLTKRESGLGLPSHTFRAILALGELVDIDLFNSLEGPLGLSIHDDGLGNPKFSSRDDKAYWENQRRKRPLFVVACGGGMGEMPDDPIDLESYVTLRAIGELHT